MEIASLPYLAVVHSTATSPQIRMSKIGRAPTLPRWNPSALDGSSPSADPREKVNNERIMKWEEISNIIASAPYALGNSSHALKWSHISTQNVCCVHHLLCNSI